MHGCIKANLKRYRSAQARKRKTFKLYGCSHAELKLINSHPDNPVRAFSQQKRGAKKRGIAWRITLWEWWNIWQHSGKWSERGSWSDSYVMCRRFDSGPYHPDNVYIGTQNHNISTIAENLRLKGLRQPKSEKKYKIVKKQKTGKPMKLDEWMKENRWGGSEFARKVECSKATISLVRHGKAKPGKGLIARISEFTNGQVTEADFNGGDDAERV